MPDKKISLRDAVKSLGIPERASIKQIRRIYKDLLFDWHPDRCKGEKTECKEMSQKIISAYKIVDAYCMDYQFSFSDEEIKSGEDQDDPEVFWKKHFGDDPIWG